MLTVSDEYKYHVQSDVQSVKPYVVATWADSRHLENVRVISTEDKYYDKTLSLNPIAFYKFNETSRISFNGTTSDNFQDSCTNQIHLTDIEAVLVQQGSLITSESTSSSVRTATYLDCTGASGCYAHIPDSDALDAATMDIRVNVALSNWAPGGGAAAQTLVAKADASGQYAYNFLVDNAGKLVIKWSSTGSNYYSLTSSVALSNVTNGKRKWLRVVLTTGTTSTATFTTSDDNTIWTTLGDVQSMSAAAMFETGTSRVTIGASGSTGATERATGKFYRVVILAPTTVLDVNFTTTGSGNGKWLVGDTSDANADGLGNSVTLAGAATIKGNSYFTSGSFNAIEDSLFNSENNLIFETWAKFDELGTTSSINTGSIMHLSTGSATVIKIYTDAGTIKADIVSTGPTTTTLVGPSANSSTIYHIVLSLNTINNVKIASLIVNGIKYQQKIINASLLTLSGGILNVGATYNGSTASDVLTGLKIGGLVIYNDTSVLFSPISFAYARYKSGSIAIVNQKNDYFEADEIINNKSGESFYWATLDAITNANLPIKASRQYYLAEEDSDKKKNEYGWWSNVESDANGAFSNKPKVFIEFDSRKVNFIDIATSSIFNKVKQFNISYLLDENYQYNNSIFYRSSSPVSISPQKSVSAVSYPIIDNPYYYNSVTSGETLSITSSSNADPPVSTSTGLDIMMHIAPTQWVSGRNQVLASKYTTATNLRCWKFTLLSDGKLQFIISTDGTNDNTYTSTSILNFANNSKHWVRVAHDKSGGTVRFYTSDDGSVDSWIMIGETTGIASLTYNNNAAPIRLASDSSGNAYNFIGDIYRAQIFGYNTTSGLDFMPTIFSVGTSGSASVTDAASNIWTMTNGSILRDSYLQCSGIALEVESTKYPLDRARVIEVSPVYKTDVSDDVIDMSLNKVRENYDSSVPLGITGSNSLDINLQNTDKKYNKYNSSSQYYPYINPEIKFQASLKYPKFSLGFPGLSNNYVSTPSTTEFDTITTLSLRFEISAENWITPTTIVSKSATGSLSWEMEFLGTTTINNNLSPSLKASFSSNGTSYGFIATSTTGCDFTAGKKYFIRCDLYQASSVSKVQFYKSNDGITWSTVGSEISHTSAITLATNTNSIVIGNNSITTKLNSFKIYSADIRIGGNSVANPNFSKNVNYDTTTVVDDYGKIWTVKQSGTGNVAKITTPKYLSVNNTGGLAYTPDSANLYSASADGLDIKIKMTLDNWYPADDQFIACKGDYGDYVGYPSYSGPAGEWYLKFNGGSDSWLEFYATSNIGGTACIDKVTDSDLGVTFEPFSTHWLRVVYNKSTANISFYYSDDGKNWTQIGSSGASALTTGIYDSTYPLMLGGVVGKSESNFVDGKIHYFLYGDNNTKTYSELDFSLWDEGVTTGSDLQGNIWTATGTVDEDYEVIPFGTFYADSVDNDGSSMAAAFRCRDRSRFIQDQTIPEGFVYTDTTAAAAIANLAKIANIPANKINIQQNLVEFTKNMSPFYYLRLNEKGQMKKAVYLPGTNSIGSIHYTSDFSFTESNPQFYNFYYESHTITVEFWIKITSTSASQNIFTINKFDNSAIDVRIFNPTNLSCSIGGATAITSGAAINDGKWHHVAVSSKGGSVSNNIKIYIDGILKVTGSSAYSYFSWNSLDSNISGSSGYINVYGNPGYISDLRIWNGERTQQEIVDNMSIELLGHETNLLSYWKFADSSDIDGNVEYCKNNSNPTYWLASTFGGDSALSSVLAKDLGIFAFFDSCYSGNATVIDPSTAPIVNQVKLINDSTSSSIDINNSFIKIVNGTSAIANSKQVTFNNSREFTFSAFIKPTSLPSSGNERYIFSTNATAGTGVQISITSTGTIKVYYGSATGKESYTAPIVAGNVYHVVVVASKTLLNSNNGYLYLYVNGVSIPFNISNVSTNPAPITTLTSHLNGDIFIGNSGNTTNATTLGTFVGLMSEIAVFPAALTSAEVAYMYQISQAIEQDIYPSLYGNQEIWNSMLEIATADIGMFYFDENDNFVYEDGNRFYDPQYNRYTTSQYTLDGSTNIVSARQSFSIVANSISCKIYKNIMDSNGDNNSIWEADNGSSLASTYLTSSISASAKTIYFKIKQEEDVYYPVFGTTGYVKIDNEIIKFNNTQKGILTVEERGALGTTAAYHAANALLGEVRVYDMEFSGAPIAYVKGPYLDAVYDGTVTYESWSAGSSRGHLVIAAVGSLDPKYIILSGTSTDGIENTFNIIGIPGSTDGSDSSESATIDNKSSIRKYGIKELIIDNKFIQSKERADGLVKFLINYYKNNIEILNMEISGLPHLQLSDRITVSSYNPMSLVNKDYWIISSSINYSGGINQSLTLREVPS